MFVSLWFAVSLVVAAVLLALLRWLLLPRPRHISLRGRHVFVTGGSQGIGRAIALEAAKQGANVTVVVRNRLRLEETCSELNQLCDLHAATDGLTQRAQWYQLDLSSGYDEVTDGGEEGALQAARVISSAEQTLGPVDVLINNVGVASQGAFDELPVDEFERVMRTNFLSAVYATRAVARRMSERAADGRIALVSSSAGQLGIWGYTAYSPSKFALRGFAEALQMELAPSGMRVTVVYPPNTNTEGFQEEVKTMPEEVRLISETAGLFEAKAVARDTLAAVRKGDFSCNFGVDGWMLGALTAGGAPETNVISAFAQIAFAGLFRFVLLFYHRHFARIVSKCAKKPGS